MANYRSLQLLRNTTAFTSKAAALAGITGSTENVSDGSIKLARYYADDAKSKVVTIFGIYETFKSGYTIYDCADNVDAALSAKIASLSASTVGGDGKYIKSVTEENGVVTAVAGDLNTSAVSRTATGGDSILSSATTVEQALEALQTAVKDIEGGLLDGGDGISVADNKINLNDDNRTVKIAGEGGKSFATGAPVAENDVYVADAIIEEGFKVLGGTVGQLTSGTEIKGGTTVIELLKKMLVKEADCTAVKPTCTLTISPTTSPVEVGTVLSETLTSTYTDGKFTGSTADYGTAYSVNAGCTQGDVTYKRGSVTVTSPDSYTMPEGTTTWSCTSTYGASTVTPKKNNGTNSSQKIASGTTASSSQSITAQYKYYLGYTIAQSASDINTTAKIKALTTKTGWVTVNGATTIVGTTAIESNGNSIVLAIPSTYKLNTVENSLGVSIKANFVNADTMTGGVGDEADATYTNASTNTEYRIYMYPISSGAKISFKNLTITKA